MRMLVLLLLCLTCVGYGRRVQAFTERSDNHWLGEVFARQTKHESPPYRGDQLRGLATLLLTRAPAAAAFVHPHPGVHALKGDGSVAGLHKPDGVGHHYPVMKLEDLKDLPDKRKTQGNWNRWLPTTIAALAAAATLSVLGGPLAAVAATQSYERATLSAENFEKVEGFEDFAAQGGKMKADPSCFFDQCKEQTTSCFTNPACLKGITCLGNCRGEQLCATQCFARFGSERLNAWLGCTLEDKLCVTTGVKQDTTKYYASPPPAMPSFTPADLDGKWYKVLGYNPKYDTYPCQTNTFTRKANGDLENDILFRVPKPDGSGSWQNNFIETLADSKGPQGKASMTVEGKMFGLTFHEQWYVLGKGDGFRVVSYIGDTQQGPYDGAFVFTKEKDALVGPGSQKMRTEIDNVVKAAGLNPAQMRPIDNTCPDDTTKAGASASEAAKEKLEWKDVFELTEWFRPGTIKKDTSFDPTKM